MEITGVEIEKMLPTPDINPSKIPECQKYLNEGSHRKLNRFSPDDYKEVAGIWGNGEVALPGDPPGDPPGELEPVDGHPEGGRIHNLMGDAKAFSPDYAPEKMFEIASKLYKRPRRAEAGSACPDRSRTSGMAPPPGSPDLPQLAVWQDDVIPDRSADGRGRGRCSVTGVYMADVIGTANSGAEAQAGWLLDVLGVDLAALRPLPPGPEGEPEYRLARGTLARREAAVKRIGDMPAPQKLLKDSYLEQAALVQAQLDIPDYVAAALLLPELQTRIGAAYAARRKGFEDAVEAKVMIAKQLQRVKATDEDGDPILDEDGDPEKAWKAPGSPEWVAMVDATLDIQLDPDFQADYDEVCDQVAGLLAADPLIQEIARDWQAIVGDFHSTDLQDKAAAEKRVKAFGDRVLKLQSQTLGIDPPTAFEFKPDPDDPESMGGYNGGTGRIDLNSAAPGNWSLREFLDTLTHENTHAYQEKLIRLLDGTALLPGEVQLQSGDSEYCAALALKLNDNAGYVSFDESEEYPDDTHEPYMEQVCEVQAWRAGERAGKGAWKKLQKVPR